MFDGKNIKSPNTYRAKGYWRATSRWSCRRLRFLKVFGRMKKVAVLLRLFLGKHKRSNALITKTSRDIAFLSVCGVMKSGVYKNKSSSRMAECLLRRSSTAGLFSFIWIALLVPRIKSRKKGTKRKKNMERAKATLKKNEALNGEIFNPAFGFASRFCLHLQCKKTSTISSRRVFFVFMTNAETSFSFRRDLACICLFFMCKTQEPHMLIQPVYYDVSRYAMLCYYVPLMRMWRHDWNILPEYVIICELSDAYYATFVITASVLMLLTMHRCGCALFNLMLTVHVHSCSWSLAINMCPTFYQYLFMRYNFTLTVMSLICCDFYTE